jgi:hypothetical protein
MAGWNDGYETDAIRLFVRDRSMQRITDANAERLAIQIRAAPDGSRTRAHRQHGWQHVHVHVPHFTH